MSVAAVVGPSILHQLPGRLRVHLSAWSGQGARQIEKHLRRTRGVRRAQANPVTGNVLICYEPATISSDALLAAIRDAERLAVQQPEPEPEHPPALTESVRGSRRRARIAVRGLDRDPDLSRRVVDRLQRHPSVIARASALTGRVLVEYDAHQIELEELIAEVADVELPDLPGEDRPAHPLDPAPLVHGATRTVGAALGLGLLVVRRLAGSTGPPRGARTAATLAGIIGLLRGFPTIRNGLRQLLGRHTADILFGTASVVTLALAGSPIGLAVTGLEGYLLWREVLARRSAWRRYEDRLAGAAEAEPGAVIRLEAGERTPRAAVVIEGSGTAIGRHGLPMKVAPGERVPAGARLFGGPFVLELQGGRAFAPQPRPAPLKPTLYTRYLRVLGSLSLAYAGLTALRTWSLGRTFEALLLVNPRPAIIGMEAANLDASARVLRAGVTVVGTRPQRHLRRPDVLLLDGPRVLSDGLELTSVLPLREDEEPAHVLSLAAGVAAAAGSPWGGVFPHGEYAMARDGHFDGESATALVDSVRYCLRPAEAALGARNASEVLVRASNFQSRAAALPRGIFWLVLQREGEDLPLGAFALRPRLASGVSELVETCQRHKVQLELFAGGDEAAAQALGRRAGVPLAPSGGVVARIRQLQQQGLFVAFVSDHAEAAPAFAACDLAIGRSSGRSGRLAARADLLVGDLAGVATIVEAGVRHDAAVRDSVLFSTAANVFGAAWGLAPEQLGGRPGVLRASLGVYVSALAALMDGWLRLRGGQPSRSSLNYLADPRPERWGRRSIPAVLQALKTRETGLTSTEAEARRQTVPRVVQSREVLAAILDQFRSPVNGFLTAGAFLALVAGQALDIVVIGLTVGLNVLIGTWQERQANQAAESLKRLGRATARVLRDGCITVVPVAELVPGDVLVLAPGDRVPADARVLVAHGLEVDEAALTGESVPVAKLAEGGTPEEQIVLEGSDVVVGTGRAVIVAVGRHTRLGATAAALTLEEIQQSPLGARLARLLTYALPAAVAGGALVVVSGLITGRSLTTQLGIGVSIALAVVPESLPLLAGTGQVGVARRLAARGVLLQRLAAVEALGRVDVVCTDKTGTLTEGRLALGLIGDAAGHEARLPGVLPDELRQVLRAAALASPDPEAADAAAHPTDVAVLQAARNVGLSADLHRKREAVAPFDPVRSFHAAVVDGRLFVKGAPETLLPRCTAIRYEQGNRPLDERGRAALAERGRRLAERGLRVLLVAEGPADVSPDEPRGLTVLGFLGIRDPLRPHVAAAVRRCQEAGVRIIMITGDHPATARAIAEEAGILGPGDEVLCGSELADLQDGSIERLKRAAVVARASPLDKLRIIEGLQRAGHTVAMTGDGVNDAPALRLADVGVAMGRAGTEVARQAADVVLADDDFATLVEGFVEGRGFWRNMRRSLGLLLGGNLGELGLVVGGSVLGLDPALNTAQILVVNLITDALPALAVALQQPEHRNLAGLAREGTTAIDASLGRDILRRGVSVSLPSLAGYLLARRSGNVALAQSVAFGSVVATQLAQTLDAGWSEDSLTAPVLGAVAGSVGMLLAAFLSPPLRTLLGLALPRPAEWALIGGSAASAVALSRLYSPAARSWLR
jgi:cation-transporting ATPase I